jgi:hypothetical protein
VAHTKHCMLQGAATKRKRAGTAAAAEPAARPIAFTGRDQVQCPSHGDETHAHASPCINADAIQQQVMRRDTAMMCMQGLTLFHALGKLLYNKRLEPDDPAQPSGTGSQAAVGGGRQTAAPAAASSQPAAGFSQPSDGARPRTSASQPTLGASASRAARPAPWPAATSNPAGPSASAPSHQLPQHSGAQQDAIDLTDDLADDLMADAIQPKPPDIDER